MHSLLQLVGINPPFNKVKITFYIFIKTYIHEYKCNAVQCMCHSFKKIEDTQTPSSLRQTNCKLSRWSADEIIEMFREDSLNKVSFSSAVDTFI